MLITPRTYLASQTPDQSFDIPGGPGRPLFGSPARWHSDSRRARWATEMLLTRQSGSLRVGEVVRYTLTYTPAADEIQPSPDAIHVKVKNTSAIPLRAAYLHGPYTLYVSCYPFSFDPNIKPELNGANHNPQFEPYLKAGGTWNAIIPVPRQIREQGDPNFPEHSNRHNVKWVIEIISQVVFSSTASVNYEILVGRDEKSTDISSFTAVTDQPKAANLRDHWSPSSKGKQVLASNGVYSDSIILLVDDTSSLWNTPGLPALHNDEENWNSNLSAKGTHIPIAGAGITAKFQDLTTTPTRTRRRKKIHLVVLTHGLHSNLGADMLYLKESIDAAAKRARQKQEGQKTPNNPVSTISASGSDSCSGDDGDKYNREEEQVIVRGFPGNAARTERGIQYLGKRLAKYVLLMTYPDQPHLPRKKSKARTSPGPFAPWKGTKAEGSHPQASCIDTEQLIPNQHYTYQITSISFIGHSLGGLVQTYAIAYIQKHSPNFFDKIKPINFIALATPFLGLSNEHPMYVRFALDFGLVGRTGQDLGLSWTAPRVRNGWEAMIGGKGESSRPRGRADVRAKPLLRVLPSGPAHEVLAKFKRRTVYSNLVNDGIVPLRTSCLLFLDWKGLERVEKARRENGIVGTVAEWGWAELTGANTKSPRPSRPINDLEVADISGSVSETTDESHTIVTERTVITQPAISTSLLEDDISAQRQSQGSPDATLTRIERNRHALPIPSSPLSGLFSMFRSKEPGHKHAKVLKRSQTLPTPLLTDPIPQDVPTCGDSPYDPGFRAPPQTTVFESASDLLMPPLPTIEFIVDPASRPRTILHDRIYCPEDIPHPVTKQRTPSVIGSRGDSEPTDPFSVEGSSNERGLNVEEKIARAYHRGMSWRKVLVRLEPDAHNNIIVRRMFSNAYGWPVVKHLVDTHFGPNSLDSSESSCEEPPGSSIPPVQEEGEMV